MRGTAQVEVVDLSTYRPAETYDYVVLVSALNSVSDASQLLTNLRAGMKASSRCIVFQRDFSPNAVRAFAELAQLECVGEMKRTLAPRSWLGAEALVLRAKGLPEAASAEKSLTICITVRNEFGNIEPIVRSIPKICSVQEVLFVEGHSHDGTREEILRVAALFPDKNVRVIGQPGKGQGDAIRVGFAAAKGDVIVLYEGDGTSDPGDIKYFYESVASGALEFVEGSRFVYPLRRDEMSFVKQMGNRFFAGWFGWFLGRRITDVLGGIKAISTEGYQKVLSSWGFLGIEDPFGDFELLYGAARHCLKSGEIPMRYGVRPYGESKTNVLRHGSILGLFLIKGFWVFRLNNDRAEP